MRIGILDIQARALARLNRSAEAKKVAGDALALVAKTPAADKAMAASLKRLAETGNAD